MPPRPIGAAIGAALREPKPKKTLPKIVKRFTTGKGDRFILTSVTKDSPLSKDTTLTLYKEIILAKGLKSYQKLEEKIVSRLKGAVKSMEKKVFDRDGKEVSSFYIFDNLFSLSSPELSLHVKREPCYGTMDNFVSINTEGPNSINIKNIRPEAKRFFKLLGEGKLENLFFEKNK